MSNFRLICGTDESQKGIVNLDFVECIDLKDGDVVFSCKESIMYFKTDLTKIEQVRYILNNPRSDSLYFTTKRLLELLNYLNYPLTVDAYDELGVVNIKGEYKLGAKKPAKYQPVTKRELIELCANENIYLGDIDTSLINDMSWLFYNSKRTNEQFEGIETWDVNNVENMEGMFCRATSFNQPLNSWNVGKVKNMREMFYGAKSFNQPLNSWNVGKVRNMSRMFFFAEDFNQPLNSWNVRNVKDMWSMFWGAKSFNQDLNSWSMDIRADTFAMFKDAEAMDIKNAMWYFIRGGLENEI